MDRIQFTNIVNHKIATINAAIHSAFVGAGELLTQLAERLGAIWSKRKPIIFQSKYPYLNKTDETTSLIAPEHFLHTKCYYLHPHNYLVGKFCKEYLENLGLTIYIRDTGTYYSHLNFVYNEIHNTDLILADLKTAVRKEFGA